jgi:hypothetical protein
MIGVAGLGVGVGLALAYAAKRNLPPPREVMNELFARIHAEYAPSKAAAAAGGQKADRRTRVEQLLDDDLEEEELEMGADYAYTANVYSPLSLESPTFPLPPALTFRCLSYLDFVELTLATGVSRRWAAFCRAMRKDRAFLHGCAERGFGDGITGAVRGRIWLILSGADQLMQSMKYAQTGDDKTMYWVRHIAGSAAHSCSVVLLSHSL